MLYLGLVSDYRMLNWRDWQEFHLGHPEWEKQEKKKLLTHHLHKKRFIQRLLNHFTLNDWAEEDVIAHKWIRYRMDLG